MMDVMIVLLEMYEIFVQNERVFLQAYHRALSVKMDIHYKIVAVSSTLFPVNSSVNQYLIFLFLLNINLMVLVVLGSLLFLKKTVELVGQIYVQMYEMDIVTVGMKARSILLTVVL
jgi:hypothetical protein